MFKTVASLSPCGKAKKKRKLQQRRKKMAVPLFQNRFIYPQFIWSPLHLESSAALINIVATSHMCVLSTCRVASTTEDMTVKYYFVLINLIAKAI